MKRAVLCPRLYSGDLEPMTKFTLMRTDPETFSKIFSLHQKLFYFLSRRDRQTDIHTDRQTDCQIVRQQTAIQTDRQQTAIQTDRQPDRQPERYKLTQLMCHLRKKYTKLKN
jgi:hypothetical protein